MSSLKMTFSLTSLILIFALAFAAMPVMGADGGPTPTITEYSGLNDPNTAASATNVAHEQERGDFRLLVTFDALVTGTIAASDFVVSVAEGVGKAAETTSASGIGTITAITEGANANKSYMVEVNLDTTASTSHDAGDYSFGYISFVLNPDVVNGNQAGHSTNGLGNVRSTALELTSQIPKNNDWSITAALDPANPVVLKGGKIENDPTDGKNTFSLKFTLSGGTGAVPAIPQGQIQVKDANGDDILTANLSVGGPSAVGLVTTVEFTGTTTEADAVATPIFIGVNPLWANAMPDGGLRIPAAGAPPKDTVHPTVDLEMVGMINEADSTFQVKFTFAEATGLAADETAGAIPTALMANQITIQKQDPADPMEMIDSDAYVQDSDIIMLSAGKWVATVHYEFDALPLYVGTSIDVSATTINGMEPGMDEDPVLRVGTPGTTPPPANAPATPDAPMAMINADNDLIIDVSWTAPADNGSAITGYTVTKYDSDGMVVKTFPETGDPAITATMLAVGPVPEADRGMSFTFTVMATNANGDSAESDMSTAVEIPEAAPVTTNNPPTFQTGASIDNIIIWQGHAYVTSVLPKARDNEGDDISYEIMGLPAGFELLADDSEDRFIEVREANKADTVVMKATKYSFVAKDQHGATSDPIEFMITVLAPIKPTMPTSVTAMEEGDLGFPENLARAVNTNKVVVNWVAPVDTTVTSHVPAIPFGTPITGYMVYRTDEDGNNPVSHPGAGEDAIKKDATNYKTPVLNRGTHNFEVAAVNSVGVGAKSTPKAAALVADVPSQPRDLRASKVPTDPNSTTLDWLLPADDGGSEILGYVIYQTLDGGPEVRIEIAPAITHRVPNLKAGRHVFRIAAYNYDGLGGRSISTAFTVDVPLDPETPANVKPTFGNATIANMTATVGTAIEAVTLPAATDPDGDDGDIKYSLSPNPAAIGLTFNTTTRFLSGTPRAQSARAYTYTARDSRGGTASLNFTLTVHGVVQPTPSGDLAATYANGVTTIASGMIAANGFATIGSEDLPDLEEFFDLGGTIGLSNGDATDDKNSRTVVISEILWGNDLGAAVDQQKMWQFIELYNTTGAAVSVAGWTVTFTAGRPVPAIDIDQVSNRSGAGWNLDKGASHGQTGRVTGTLATDLESAITPTNIVSMYRNINYDHVEKNVAKRNELVKGIPGGNASGSWKASQRRSEYNRWIYDSKRAEHFKATPILTASSVARTPFIINEVGNNSGDTNDWVEIRNVTSSEASLKNYHLSLLSGFDSDTSLVNFHGKDIKVPGNSVILLVNTDPKNTGIAAGRNAAVAEADQELTGVTSRYYINSNLKLPDDGKFNLILRNAHDKLKASSHFMDVIGGLVVADATKGTSLWPLVATGGPHGNVIEGHGRDLKSPYVYIRKNAGGGTGEKHLGRVGYTGVGYDRVALKSDANGGTPGYDNGAVKEKIADLIAADSSADVSISEIMLESKQGRQNLPQWIELYNSSMTHSVNTNGWKLHIENTNDVNTALDSVLTLGSMTIPPNQTILIVTNTGRVSDPDHFPSTRLVNLWTTKAHRDALEMIRRTDQVFSTTGLYLKLTDKDNKLVDEAGNLDGNRRTRDEPNWAIPMGEDDERRSSLLRVYDAGVAIDGKMAAAWVLADETDLAFAISQTYYGDPDDFGTPGFRGGGPLPASLSKFRPERLDDGSIVVRWITESELNNAGFNILRSETRNGEFTKVHFEAGEGTTTERNVYEWTDKSAKPNVVYYYQIQDVSLDGEVTTLRMSRLKGDISPDGKLTTTWGDIKALQ